MIRSLLFARALKGIICVSLACVPAIFVKSASGTAVEGYNLVLDGSIDGVDAPFVTLTNTSDSASITAFSMTIGHISYNFDACTSFASSSGVTATLLRPDQNDNGGVRSDDLAFAYAGFGASKFFRFRPDLDPDSFNKDIDFRHVLFDLNGSNNNDNASFSVSFSNGVIFTKLMPDVPDTGTTTFQFSDSNEPIFCAATGSYYQYVTGPPTGARTWNDARDDAHARSYLGRTGHLVTITSAAENNFIQNTWGHHGWIGAIQTANAGEYMWGDGPESGSVFWTGGPSGSTVGGAYAHFAPGSPNLTEPSGEDAIRMWGLENGDGSSVGLWDNAYRTDTANYYVEYSPVPEPSGLAVVLIAGLLVLRHRTLALGWPVRSEASRTG